MSATVITERFISPAASLLSPPLNLARSEPFIMWVFMARRHFYTRLLSRQLENAPGGDDTVLQRKATIIIGYKSQ